LNSWVSLDSYWLELGQANLQEAIACGLQMAERVTVSLRLQNEVGRPGC
jgi:hypothetical protein